jgi:hypothetical protein
MEFTMPSKITTALVSCLLYSAALISAAVADDPIGEPGRKAGAKNPLKNVYFGEQHLHTSASPDAFAVGTRGTWADAYDYALGKEVKLSTTGVKMKKSTPYDFVAITDHAEYFGVMPRMLDPKDPLSKTPLGKKLQGPDAGSMKPGSAISTILHSLTTATPLKEYLKPKLLKSNWEEYAKVANQYNDPGKFTTLIAFEWTSIPNAENMHRNVFFRNYTGPRAVFSAFDSVQPEDLWTYLEVQRNAGNETFAIPHLQTLI